MAKYHFNGPATNLGRFGEVRKGDILNLTQHEASHVDGDARFEVFDEKKHGKKLERIKVVLPKGFDKMKKAEQDEVIKEFGLPANFADLSEKAQAEAIKAAQQAADAEFDRQSTVESRNTDTTVEEIRQLPKDKLDDYIRQLRADGKTVDVTEKADAKQKRKAIIETLFGDNAGKDETGGED